MANLPLNLIKDLYYKEGLSTIEIGKKIGVSEWVVLKFMKRMGLPRRTFKEANAIVFARKKPSFSLRKSLTCKEQKLKVAGVMLYWAEGGRLQGRNCNVDFTNSNSEMIKIFLKFLRKICGIKEEKLRVQLYCYANQDIESLKKYWYKVTSIPLKQFIKPYVRKDFKKGNDKMRYGLVHIRYSDKKLLYKIEEWIQDYCKRVLVIG